MRWDCRIKDIEHTKQITGFTVSGKGSLYHVYLIEFNQTRWLDIPEIGMVLCQDFGLHKYEKFN